MGRDHSNARGRKKKFIAQKGGELFWNLNKREEYFGERSWGDISKNNGRKKKGLHERFQTPPLFLKREERSRQENAIKLFPVRLKKKKTKKGH